MPEIYVNGIKIAELPDKPGRYPSDCGDIEILAVSSSYLKMKGPGDGSRRRIDFGLEGRGISALKGGEVLEVRTYHPKMENIEYGKDGTRIIDTYGHGLNTWSGKDRYTEDVVRNDYA